MHCLILSVEQCDNATRRSKSVLARARGNRGARDIATTDFSSALRGGARYGRAAFSDDLSAGSRMPVYELEQAFWSDRTDADAAGVPWSQRSDVSSAGAISSGRH